MKSETVRDPTVYYFHIPKNLPFFDHRCLCLRYVAGNLNRNLFNRDISVTYAVL